MKSKISSLAIICLLIASSLMVLTPNATAFASAYYEVLPELKEFGPAPCEGQEFSIAVWLKNVTTQTVPKGVFGVEIKLQWNETYLELRRVLLKIGVSGGVLNAPYFTAKNESIGTNTWWISASSLAGAQPWFGEGIVAEFTFRIIKQPKELLGETDVTTKLALIFTDLVDSEAKPVSHDRKDGTVIIHAQPYKYPPAPTVEVRPSVYKARNLGETFDIAIYITSYDETGKEVGVDSFWDVSGFDISLYYDPTLIWPISITEGDFLKKTGSPTWGWISNDTDAGKIWAVYTMVGLPHTPVSGTGNLLIITFKAIFEAETYPPATCTLNLDDVHLASWPHPERLMRPWEGRPYAVELWLDQVKDGQYYSPYVLPGGWIDVYTQYPDPYGGQGPNMPSDMFWPQKEVILYANVRYGRWPEQNKDVAFQVIDPHGETWAVIYARTNASGVATTSFRLPWPCDNPEYWLGTWKVIASVDVACKIVNDTLEFKYDYHVRVWKTTADKTAYNHGETITVTVKYGTVSMQEFDALIVVTALDDTGVPFGIASTWVTAGGAQWCTYANGTVTLTINIPKFARQGTAKLIVLFMHDWPVYGGDAIYPAREPESLVKIGIRGY